MALSCQKDQKKGEKNIESAPSRLCCSIKCALHVRKKTKQKKQHKTHRGERVELLGEVGGGVGGIFFFFLCNQLSAACHVMRILPASKSVQSDGGTLLERLTELDSGNRFHRTVIRNIHLPDECSGGGAEGGREGVWALH